MYAVKRCLFSSNLCNGCIKIAHESFFSTDLSSDRNSWSRQLLLAKCYGSIQLFNLSPQCLHMLLLSLLLCLTLADVLQGFKTTKWTTKNILKTPHTFVQYHSFADFATRISRCIDDKHLQLVKPLLQGNSTLETQHCFFSPHTLMLPLLFCSAEIWDCLLSSL